MVDALRWMFLNQKGGQSRPAHRMWTAQPTLALIKTSRLHMGEIHPIILNEKYVDGYPSIWAVIVSLDKR